MITRKRILKVLDGELEQLDLAIQESARCGESLETRAISHRTLVYLTDVRKYVADEKDLSDLPPHLMAVLLQAIQYQL